MELKLNEFCEQGNLELYRDIIENVFLKIKEADCNISAIYNSDRSVHISGVNFCLIQISLSRKYQRPIHILWTILHEFGHHLSTPINSHNQGNIKLVIESEKKAWEHAYDNIQKYPELLIEITDFNDFKEKELESYYQIKG